jgi:hypothetical protein
MYDSDNDPVLALQPLADQAVQFSHMDDDVTVYVPMKVGDIKRAEYVFHRHRMKEKAAT